MTVSFRVFGLPAPQGSKTRLPNGAIVEGASKGQRERHRDWRSAVAAAADEALRESELLLALDGPLRLDVVFRFPMPKSRPKAVREAGEALKVSAPDLDKLVRSLGDGLESGGLIASDARIAEVHARKIEVTGWTGASVTVRQLDPTLTRG